MSYRSWGLALGALAVVGASWLLPACSVSGDVDAASTGSGGGQENGQGGAVPQPPADELVTAADNSPVAAGAGGGGGGGEAPTTMPNGCPTDGVWRSYESTPLPWGSMASAQYAAALVADGITPLPDVLELGDFLAYFGPERGSETAVVGSLDPASVDEASTEALLDVTVVPPAPAAGSSVRSPMHLVVLADASQSMYGELGLEADALRVLGRALDVQGDRLTVLRWSSVPEQLTSAGQAPTAAADQAAASLLAGAEQLPPSADALVLVDLVEAVDPEHDAHVLLLSDGGSPVDPSALARLAKGGRQLSAAQLVDPQRTMDQVGFAGAFLRGVAREGQGAAWWLRDDSTELALLEAEFDAMFRTQVMTRVRLDLPYEAFDPANGGGEPVSARRGVAAPARVVLRVSSCSPDLFASTPGTAEHWGAFALDDGEGIPIGTVAAGQAQWLAARGAFELVSNGCPDTLPVGLMGLLGQLPLGVSPRAAALDAFVRDYLRLCGLTP